MHPLDKKVLLYWYYLPILRGDEGFFQSNNTGSCLTNTVREHSVSQEIYLLEVSIDTHLCSHALGHYIENRIGLMQVFKTIQTIYNKTVL